MTITTPYGDEQAMVTRAFMLDSNPNAVLALTGSEHCDHALWLVDQAARKATLVGTLVEPEYKKMRRTHVLRLDVDGARFEWLAKPEPATPYSGHVGEANLSGCYSITNVDLYTGPYKFYRAQF